MNNTDFVSDHNPTAVFHAARELGAPDYVKEAKIIQPSDLVTLSDVAFADRANRLFPIHTKAAAWLSKAYLTGMESSHPELSASIDTAGGLLGISEDLAKIDDLFASAKSASVSAVTEQNDQTTEKAAFALTVNFGDPSAKGAQEDLRRFYPIHNFGSVLGSAELMMKDAHENRLPVDYFYLAARELVKAASEHGVPSDMIHDSITEAGDWRWPNFDTARWEADRRKSAGVSEDNMQMYTDLVAGAKSEFETAEGMDKTACIDKWASLWMDLDARNGITNYDNLLNPFQAFYSGTKLNDLDKRASMHFVVSDVMIPRVEMQSLSETSIEACFSKSAAEIIRDAKKDLEDHLHIEKSASASTKLSHLNEDDRKELLRLLISNAA